MNLSILYEDALRLVGYDVKLIRNGLEAVNAIELNEPPTLIILDVNLPGLSGRDVLQHIRKNRRYDDVPVLVSTANSVMAKVIEPELSDNDSLFIKPVSMVELQKMAKAIAKQKQADATQTMSAIETARSSQTMKAVTDTSETKQVSDDAPQSAARDETMPASAETAQDNAQDSTQTTEPEESKSNSDNAVDKTDQHKTDEDKAAQS
jgi:DNA-binding response OmpR family regulator